MNDRLGVILWCDSIPESDLSSLRVSCLAKFVWFCPHNLILCKKIWKSLWTTGNTRCVRPPRKSFQVPTLWGSFIGPECLTKPQVCVAILSTKGRQDKSCHSAASSAAKTSAKGKGSRRFWRLTTRWRCSALKNRRATRQTSKTPSESWRPAPCTRDVWLPFAWRQCACHN